MSRITNKTDEKIVIEPGETINIKMSVLWYRVMSKRLREIEINELDK